MTSRSMRRIASAFALMLLSACRDASTGPSTAGGETIVVSIAGIDADAAGIVLRLSGSVEAVEAADASLQLAWAMDDVTTATVAVLGPVADVRQLLTVRMRAGAAALSVQPIDVTDGDGTLSLPTTARVVVTSGT